MRRAFKVIISLNYPENTSVYIWPGVGDHNWTFTVHVLVADTKHRDTWKKL